ncbi:hypothetical protein [Clostridium neonatale]|uniref:hypothetical protein n=1 Tax=Clostridium neonatale TaxID=137838 RepID=UPI00291B83FE|nr:hypothetical protein [Clostridium neonatale]CAI3615514.1 conserved membrane hypothetical protein [Clostridium neonatale]
MKKKLIILSMSPLFFLTFIQNFPWDKLNKINRNILNINELLKHKSLIIGLVICLIWLLSSICVYIQFRFFFKYGRDSGYTIKDLKEEKEAGLNFFLALILPMMNNDISKFNVLLSFITLIFIIVLLLYKTNLYYQNPILIIAGYKIYKFKFVNNEELGLYEYIGISFDKVDGSNSIEYKKIEDNVLIIKQMR